MSELTYGDFLRALHSSRKDDCYRYVSQLEKDRARLRAEVEELVGALRDVRNGWMTRYARGSALRMGVRVTSPPIAARVNFTNAQH